MPDETKPAHQAVANACLFCLATHRAAMTAATSFRLLVVGALTAVAFLGLALAIWWHNTADLQALDQRAQQLGWQLPDLSATPTADEMTPPVLTAQEWQKWTAPGAPFGEFTKQHPTLPIDDGGAVLLDSTEGTLASANVYPAVEQTLLAIIIEHTSFQDGILRCLRLIERCPKGTPGLHLVVQLAAPRIAGLDADAKITVATSLRQLAAREKAQLTDAMHEMWFAVRALPALSQPTLISAQGWSLRLGRAAYLERFIAWGEAPPELTAATLQALREHSSRPLGIFAAATAWSQAGAAIQLQLATDVIATTTLAQTFAAACTGGTPPTDRTDRTGSTGSTDPNGAALRHVPAGPNFQKWYVVGLNGVDEKGGGDDVSITLPQKIFAP